MGPAGGVSVQVREDKSPEDASGPDYIKDLFVAQARKSDHLPSADAII